MRLLRNMDMRLDDLTTQIERFETRMERVEADQGSPIPRYADDLMCQGCGISDEIEEPRPVPPATKPVTEAPTPAQIQEQYGARSEKDEVYETPITKKEPTHKGLPKSHQESDIDSTE